MVVPRIPCGLLRPLSATFDMAGELRKPSSASESSENVAGNSARNSDSVEGGGSDDHQEEENHIEETPDDSAYGDDEKGGSGVETSYMDYADGDSEIFREGAGEGSVSPSYSSMRVEPDLEDTHSNLRLEEIYEGDGSGSESGADLSNFSDAFAVSELELIEHALQSFRNNHKHGEEEMSSRSTVEGDIVDQNEGEVRESDYVGDSKGVSRLLKKVQAAKAQKQDALATKRGKNNRSPRPGLLSDADDEEIDSGDMRQIIQAASRAAVSAAKTAEAVVTSIDRNSQAIEELCRSLTLKGSEEDPKLRDGDEDDDTKNELMRLQQSELDIELRQAEITKNLVRQNRLTHWILGFIVVTSLAWRFGVVKFVRRVNHAVSNPFEGITSAFDNLTGNNEKHKKDKQGRGIKLPDVLAGDSDGSDDGDLPFNLDKLLPHSDTKKEETKVEATKKTSRTRHSSMD